MTIKLIGAMTTAEGVYFYKCGLFFADTYIMPVQLGSSEENMGYENYATWETVVEMVNRSNTSIVDYRIKDIPASAQAKDPLPYESVKSVNIRKRH